MTLLLPLLQHTTNETLYLLLETIRAVIALDKELLTPDSTSEVAVQVYQIWLMYSTGRPSLACHADIQILFSPPSWKSCLRRLPFFLGPRCSIA